MDMDFEDTDLILGLGPIPKSATNSQPLEPSLTLGLSRQLSSSDPNNAISSFSGVKVENDTVSDQEAERISNSKVSDPEEEEEEEEEGSCRKKLRLTKDQYALLEDKFREHTTLNPKQKQALAKQLNLRPRQVEVWFQNRRARTKLKQTEMDCEVLKKCFGRLSNENKKLHKELIQLKSAASPPMYMHPPPTSISLCRSCKK